MMILSVGSRAEILPRFISSLKPSAFPAVYLLSPISTNTQAYVSFVRHLGLTCVAFRDE
jgi:hypothetical protein